MMLVAACGLEPGILMETLLGHEVDPLKAWLGTVRGLCNGLEA